MTTLLGHRRSTAFYSLRFRLPALITGLVVLILSTFLWLAYRRVVTVSVEMAGARAQSATDYLAPLLAQGSRLRLEETRRVAAMPAIREYLERPSDRERRAAAEASLKTLMAVRQTVVELWSDSGERVLTLPNPTAEQTAPVPLTPPSAAGVALQAAGTVVFSEAVAKVSVDVPGKSSQSIGLVVERRPLTVPTGEVLGKLVGNGAAVEIGDRRSGVWVDLTKIVAPPAVDLARPGIAEYRTAGERHIGALADIEGTPWALWVDFPYAVVVAPAQLFLGRMTMLALLFGVATAVAAGLLSGRITRPLTHVTEVSEAIAAGAYERRVVTTRQGEIGRLAAAFNAMAAQVDASHRDLEQRVQQRTEELDRFFSLSLDLLCIAGTDGRFRRLNPAWEDTLGWTVAELMSAPTFDFIHPDDHATTMVEMAKLVQGGVGHRFENRYRCKDGSYRWLSWKVAVLLDRGLIYGAARDITALKDAAREQEQQATELQAARAEADRANLAKSEFLSRMSHEFRTPLNAILGFAQVLELDHLRDDQVEAVRQIMHGGKHLLALINEVIDISRIESGRLSLSPESVAVDDVVNSAVALIQPLAAERGITIRIERSERPVAVRADRQRLNQILLNLLSNAVKYNRDKGRVTVGWELSVADRCRIRVTDTGAGIPAAKLTLLFQPFERLGTEGTAVEGTGLGLAVSKALAGAMGGVLSVESIPDHGSTFWVELPTAHPVERITAPEAASAPSGAAHSEAVVVYIEDNLPNVRLMERILKYRPRTTLLHAADGESGLALVRERRPHVILLDMHLPDMPGDEVLRRLWEDPHSRRVPVVVVTADATPGLIRRLQGAGASAHLTKPINVKQVLQVLDSLIRTSEEDHEHA